MIRSTTEDDLPRIRALMQSTPGFWHEEWREDAQQRAVHAT